MQYFYCAFRVWPSIPPFIHPSLHPSTHPSIPPSLPIFLSFHMDCLFPQRIHLDSPGMWQLLPWTSIQLTSTGTTRRRQNPSWPTPWSTLYPTIQVSTQHASPNKPNPTCKSWQSKSNMQVLINQIHLVNIFVQVLFFSVSDIFVQQALSSNQRNYTISKSQS